MISQEHAGQDDRSPSISGDPIGAHLKPLGVFGVHSVTGPAELWPLVGAIPPQQRRPILKHLDRGIPVGGSIMGFRTDVLQDRSPQWSFGGHSTDGVYFWSDEAGEYIREYGVGLPPEVIEHCLFGVTDESLDWVRAHASEIGRYLEDVVYPRLAAESWYDVPEGDAPTIESVDTDDLRVIGDIHSDDKAERPWLDQLVRHGNDPERRAYFAGYLDACPVVLRGTTRVDDTIRPDWRKVAPNAIQTDGKYLWRSDYAHYVRLHGAALPDDMIQRSMQYDNVNLTDEVLDTIRVTVRSGALRDPARRWTPT